MRFIPSMTPPGTRSKAMNECPPLAASTRSISAAGLIG
jgi:hypothetical protein